MEISAFKKIVNSIARDTNGTVINTFGPGPTPNFFAANISLPEHGNIAVLHNLHGDWAFARAYVEGVCELSFVDCIPLANALRAAFQIEVLSKSTLNGPFDKQQYHDAYDVRYWKPKSLGEGLFNWWD